MNRAPWAFLACCSVWGTTFLVIRSSNGVFAPLWGSGLRLALAAILLIAAWLVLRQPFPRGRALAVVVAFGLLDFGINLGLLYWGERSVPSGLSAVFYATAPVTTALVAAALGQEKLRAGRLLGMLAAFAGVVVVFAAELGQRADPWALLAVLGAATCAALSGIVLRSLPPQPVLPTVALGCGASAVLLLVASVAFGEPRALPTSFASWWPVVYLAVLGSVVAFGLYTWLLTQWSASSTAMAGVVVPVLAVIVGALVGGERPGVAALAGGVLVVAGVAVVLRSPAR